MLQTVLSTASKPTSHRYINNYIKEIFPSPDSPHSIPFFQMSSSDYPPKRGLVLVRDKEKNTWSQKLLEFTPSLSQISLRETVTGPPSFVGIIPDRKEFQIHPSPYRVPTMPDSVGLHIYPIHDDEDPEMSTEIYFTIFDKQQVLDWSYYFRNWVSSAPNGTTSSSPPPAFIDPLSAPLSTEEQTISARMLGSSDHDDCEIIPQDPTVIASKFNAEISIKTLQCLRRSEWLSDEIINYYFQLLNERKKNSKSCFSWSSFFWTKLSSHERLEYKYRGVQNWSTKKAIDVFSFDILFVPLNIEKSHWALGVVDMKNHTTHYLDSLDRDTDYPLFHEYIQRYLRDEWSDKKKVGECPKFISEKPPSNLPLQKNGNDCGVYVTLFALAIASGIPIDELGDTKRVFGNENILNFRKRILADIVRGSIAN